ncbi:MAG: U32 family peptidase, partial [Bacteroidales bacterium]|nr:U32 family peptidase [Bacteroidales bacterium]
MTELELLAPARNADIGIAAIDCGADAVYMAGPAFGARQDAGNSMEDVKRLCDYAHKFGARIFLTLNTILYDSEIPEAERILHEAAEAGVDAVIAQDLAVFEILRSAQNDMEAHASTQCAIRTPEQARYYESLGASRIVLERQLSLEQIRAIREAVSCEIEFFVHGALCVCYSGQCYMSEAVAGRSANRGACVQACRSLYDLEDSSGKILVKDKALLSLKDFNLIERLSDLAEAGVCSFKIEGRLKNISYVRNTVRAYSLALDELIARHPDKYRRASFGKVEGGFTPDLRKTFNRGYTELFIDGKRGKWSSMDAPKSAGEEIGTVVSILGGRPSGPGRVHSRFALRLRSGLAAAEYGLRPAAAPPKDNNMEVLVRLDNPATTLRNGDGFTFTPKGGGEIRGFRGDVCEGNRIICKEVPGLYVGARLRRNLSVTFEKEIEANLPVRLIHVRVDLAAGIAAWLMPYSAAASPERSRRAKREWTRPGQDGVPTYTIKVKAESEDGRTVEFEMDAGNQEANNVERMGAMFKTQIEKVSGI